MAHQAPVSAGPSNPAIIKNPKVYDALKFYALIILPAIGTLYFTMAQIWGLPAAGQVVGSITAVDTFMGVVLHISNVQYQNSDASSDGVASFTTNPDGHVTMDITPHYDPQTTWVNQDKVTLKVNPPGSDA